MSEEALITQSDILPSSRLRDDKNVEYCPGGAAWVPIFCANCGEDGGRILESEWNVVKAFAFYLCNPCAEKWAPLVGMAISPDEAFWEKLRRVQMESYGRELTQDELIQKLSEPDSVISKLAKERKYFQ